MFKWYLNVKNFFFKNVLNCDIIMEVFKKNVNFKLWKLGFLENLWMNFKE